MKFKFRSECIYDIIRFVGSNKHKDYIKFIIEKDSELPDCTVEFTTDLSKETILDVMRKISDSHVMMQTLAVKSEYTGIRDYNIK